MSRSPPTISLLDEEIAWVTEHQAVIERVKRVKEDHQRLWEEEAQREAKAKKAWREAEGKEAWRQAEEVEKACKEAEGAEKA